MDFFKFFSSLNEEIYSVIFLLLVVALVIIKNKNTNKSMGSTEGYIDLGDGPSWFNDYRAQGKPTLSKFFGLNKENQIKIDATIGKTGFYQTPKGKRWAVIAHYTDSQSKKEYTFYCPEWTYDPIAEHRIGNNLEMFVDKNDYGKYEMPIY